MYAQPFYQLKLFLCDISLSQPWDGGVQNCTPTVLKF